DLTERRSVDPADGQLNVEDAVAAVLDGKGAGAAPPPLDAPLASLVDSGAAPPAKPPTPALNKPAAVSVKPGGGGGPRKITTDRPRATESGGSRSDARYRRQRGKGLYWAIAVLLVGAGIGGGGLYYKRERDRRAAAAMGAGAAAPPFAAGQGVSPPPPQPA